MNKMLRVGIASVVDQRARSLAIAAGTRKRSAGHLTIVPVSLKSWPKSARLAFRP